MRSIISIAVVTSLVAAACARSVPGSEDANIVIDTDQDTSDAGSRDTGAPDSDPTVDVSHAAELEEPVLVAAPDDDSTQELLIFDAGESMFTIGDRSHLGWVGKDGGPIFGYETWPSFIEPDAGPPVTDAVFDDDRFWMLCESGAGWKLYGVEHFLGAATPLFGQPIIVLDTGPLTTPHGISRFGNQMLIADADGFVLVGETSPWARTPWAGSPVFDHMDHGKLVIETESRWEVIGFDLAAGDFGVLHELQATPLAFAASDDDVVWLDPGGFVVRNDATVASSSGATADSLVAVGAAGIAWSLDGEVRFVDDDRPLRRIRTDGQPDTMFVDDTSVYWSTADGIWRAP